VALITTHFYDDVHPKSEIHEAIVDLIAKNPEKYVK
jgi:hypothetical protein